MLYALCGLCFSIGLGSGVVVASWFWAAGDADREMGLK